VRDIAGFEGLYAVTSCGKVWSYKSKKFLSQRLDRYGYLLVNLSKNGVQKTYLVHRLVAEAYIPNPLGLPQVNHRSENKTENHINNLEWISAKDNVNYGTRNERAARANSKPVHCIELDETFPSLKSAGEELKIHPQCISECLRGKQKTAGKLHWEYAE
jgi:hypothetical protein